MIRSKILVGFYFVVIHGFVTWRGRGGEGRGGEGGGKGEGEGHAGGGENHHK